MRATVIVDQRERNSELLEALESIGVEIDMKTLPVGDYVLSDRVCIERKTVQDFESSMMSGRLFEQIERLKKSYAAPMLLLEGDRSTFRLKSRVINGAIASLYIDYGIVVISAHSVSDAAEIIASMAAHEQSEEKREPSLKGSARAYTHEQFQEYVIGNLPGVGPKLAKALLLHFGSVRGVANASAEELMKVDKIGEKKAELILKTFNSKYSKD
jgi:Fanconi anemia group M protein